jgi:hypothetical protein
MCCFSRPIDHVSNTQIFARSSHQGRQYVVYSMQIQMKEELAMILPIPVPRNSPDDAVRFISLKEYAAFFEDLARGWPPPRVAVSASRSGGSFGGSKPLPVIDVGDFGASFVPSVNDFSRLDAQFRLPDAAWDQLPRYRDFGFAVFKLKEGAAKQKVHPMAFEFPRANRQRLFFPTVHIHDGEVHPQAQFDHVLYCQTTGGEKLPMMEWSESPQLAEQFVKIDQAAGLIHGGSHVHRRYIRGKRKNEDILV